MHASTTSFWEAEHASAGRFPSVQAVSRPGRLTLTPAARALSVISGKRHDEIGPALIEHCLMRVSTGAQKGLFAKSLYRCEIEAGLETLEVAPSAIPFNWPIICSMTRLPKPRREGVCSAGPSISVQRTVSCPPAS